MKSQKLSTGQEKICLDMRSMYTKAFQSEKCKDFYDSDTMKTKRRKKSYRLPEFYGMKRYRL
jgi:hypothetical protein